MRTTNFLRLIVPTILIIVLTSCSPIKVSYLGNDYGTSREVELFFSTRDLPKKYTVIGEMILTAPEEVKSKKVQRKLLREAKQRGATGALVEEFEVMQNGRLGDNGGHHFQDYHNSSHGKYGNGTYVKVALIAF